MFIPQNLSSTNTITPLKKTYVLLDTPLRLNRKTEITLHFKEKPLFGTPTPSLKVQSVQDDTPPEGSTSKKSKASIIKTIGSSINSGIPLSIKKMASNTVNIFNPDQRKANRLVKAFYDGLTKRQILIDGHQKKIYKPSIIDQIKKEAKDGSFDFGPMSSLMDNLRIVYDNADTELQKNTFNQIEMMFTKAFAKEGIEWIPLSQRTPIPSTIDSSSPKPSIEGPLNIQEMYNEKKREREQIEYSPGNFASLVDLSTAQRQKEVDTGAASSNEEASLEDVVADYLGEGSLLRGVSPFKNPRPAPTPSTEKIAYSPSVYSQDTKGKENADPRTLSMAVKATSTSPEPPSPISPQLPPMPPIPTSFKPTSYSARMAKKEQGPSS